MKSRKTHTPVSNRYKWLIIILVFIFALLLRLWHINANGRAWDEGDSAQIDYQFGKLIRTGDFTNPYWWHYYPDHPRLVRYLYGAVNWLDVDHFDKNGNPVFRYDLTYSRILASVVASVTVLLVVLYGWRYFSPLIGVTSGIILSMLPIFIGHSQISMFEPFVIFFFTAAVFAYTRFLESNSTNSAILTGVLIGLAVAVKETNLLLLPLFISQYIVLYFYKKKTPLFNKKLLLIFLIACITFFIHWPMVWFHLDYIVKFTYQLRVENTGGIPELLFGKLHRTTVFHYVIYFLTTTPILVLIFLIPGIWKSIKSKKWIYISLLLWFFIPFLQSLYPKREQGIRYIIEFYSPLSLLAGIGFDAFISKFMSSNVKKFFFFIPVIIYFCIILQRIDPYYLDYFNILVGGTKTVYEKRLLHMGWWGDGLKEAAVYVQNNAKHSDTLGLAISPSHTLPPLPGVKVLNYSSKESFDYVMVNNYHIIRDGFDDTQIKKQYRLVKTVNADGAVLVSVYKRK